MEFIVYHGFENDLFRGMSGLMERFDRGELRPEQDRSTLLSCVAGLLDMAGHSGFSGNLWHCYLADLLVNDENSYSLACEMRGEVTGTIGDLALRDIALIKRCFDYDFTPLIRQLEVPELALLLAYTATQQGSRIYNRRICRRICELAGQLAESQSPEAFKACLAQFYGEYGVGSFGLHKAFRVLQEGNEVAIRPIGGIAHVHLDDLVGYELPKRKLTDNTDAFVEGRKANNCLLFGDAGTGKSSSVKALANEYYGRGLRIIEIYKHQFRALNDVISQIKNRNYRFIIYMDDLSFEDFETEYKYLKAVIEGGLEKKPENVLIYATSNRRHLIRENYGDREEIREDLHAGDTVQEKLSLAYRFGVTIYFGAPDKKQFQEIVAALADREGIAISREELFAEANKWELSHGGLSGRTARQFVDYISNVSAMRSAGTEVCPQEIGE